MNKTVKYISDGRAPIPEKESISKIMSAIKDRNTEPELILRKALWTNGIRGYRLHWKKIPGRPDISLPGKRIAIPVNECFWHRCPRCHPSTPKTHSSFWKEKFEENIERDKRKIEQLIALHWETLTVWECEIKNGKDRIVDNIKKLISS